MLSKLVYKPYTGTNNKYKYTVKEQYSYHTRIRPTEDITTDYYLIKKTGEVVAKVGYTWDGATGIPDTDSNMEASLIHDVLCQAMAEGFLDMKEHREVADRVFVDVLTEVGGMCRVLAEVHYIGLRVYGLVRYGV